MMQVQNFLARKSTHRYPIDNDEILRLLMVLAHNCSKIGGKPRLFPFQMSPPVFIQVENLARDIRSLIDIKIYPFV
jgi:hypothetical protein